jgi:hypothetical protein
MATDWDPGSPDSIGLSFFPTQQGEQQLPAAVTFASTATETVDALHVYLDHTDDAYVLAEIYVSGDEVPGAVTTDIFRPNADLANQANAWLNESLSTSNLYQSIDEATADDTDFILYFGPQSPAKYYRFNVATAGALWPANQRVIGGFVRIRARRIDANGQLYVSYFNGTTAYRLGTITVTQDIQNFNIPWPEYNPATGLPWTRAEIQALDGAAGIQLKPKNVNKRKSLRVYQAYLSLDWVAEERVGVGVIDPSSMAENADTDSACAIVVPNTGVTGWSKLTATSYTLLLKRISGFGIVSWRFLTETPEVSEALLRPDQSFGNPVSSFIPVLDSRGLVSVLGDAVAGRALGFYFFLSTTAFSADGQPYNVVLPGAVESTVDVEQEITVGTGDTYDRVRVLVTAGDADSDLFVKIKRRSDNTQFGSTESLTVADATLLPALATLDGINVVLWEAVLGTPATLTTVQYYVEFSSGASEPWHVLYLDGGGGSGPASFGGTTDRASVGASTDIATADVPTTLSTVVDAPEDFAALTDTDEFADGLGCTVPEIDNILLTWSATTLGSDFGGYQIERDDTGEFVQIRYGTEEDADVTDDRESIRGEEAGYRLRVVRAGDWVPSPWTDETFATADAYGSEVVFASNWLEDSNAVNRTPEYGWGQPNNDRVLQLAGRNYQIVFQESENRGDGGSDGFEIEAIVFAGSDEALQPVPDGRAAFAPLIDFLRIYTPYLAVLDFMGGRWYGRATVDEATITMSRDTAGQYEATIRIVVTQDTPTPAPIPSSGS